MKTIKLSLTMVLLICMVFDSSVINYEHSKAAENPNKPSFELKSTSDDTGIKIMISKTSYVDGYRIYMKYPGQKKYKKITTLKKSGKKKRSFTEENLDPGEYSVKIKAYNKNNGKTVWGEYSDVKKITLNSKQDDNNDNSNENFYEDINQDTIKIGDIIKFGTYEQDTNFSNGKEPIEWIVLNIDAKEKTAFLLSKSGLDAKDYHNEQVNVSWKNSSIRNWLNNDFYTYAFSSEEKQKIIQTETENVNGNSTWDKVFLLSEYDVVFGYANKPDILECKPTAYANTKNVSQQERNTLSGIYYCDWWLRTSGSSESSALYVPSSGGSVSFRTSSKSVYHGFWYLIGNAYRERYGAVRPAMYVKLEDRIVDNDEDNKKEEELHRDFQNLKPGEIIKLGYYEQDNDITDGKEQIEWQVLYVDNINKKALLVSRYVLDSILYFEDAIDCQHCDPNRNYTWEDSSLRSWLNNDFYNSAFSAEDKTIIEDTFLPNPDNTEYGVEGGNDTTDKVFLLSVSDVTNPLYGFDSEKKSQDIFRRCAPTKYAKARRVAQWSGHNNTKNADGEYSADWWLRSPGFKSTHIYNVGGNGYIDWDWICEYSIGVRPAMYIKIQ